MQIVVGLKKCCSFDRHMKQHHRFHEAKSYSIEIFVQSVYKILNEGYGFTQDNTLCGASFCPDQLNSSFTHIMTDVWGSFFQFGGISGIPFPGKSGYKAFLGHVPHNGNIIITYGSHIGMTKEGQLGKSVRPGMQKQSLCCGSMFSAWDYLSKNIPIDNYLDMQLHYLATSLKAYQSNILQYQHDRDRTLELVYSNYLIIDEYVRRILEACPYKAGKTVLAGGILINTPGNEEDVFVPMCLEMQLSKRTKSLLETL